MKESGAKEILKTKVRLKTLVILDRCRKRTGKVNKQVVIMIFGGQKEEVVRKEGPEGEQK